jgi:hypothetical protein
MDSTIIGNEKAFDGLLAEAASLVARLQATDAFVQYRADYFSLRARAAANRTDRARLGTARYAGFSVPDIPFRKGLPPDPLSLGPLPNQSQQLQQFQQQQPLHFHGLSHPAVVALGQHVYLSKDKGHENVAADNRHIRRQCQSYTLGGLACFAIPAVQQGRHCVWSRYCAVGPMGRARSLFAGPQSSKQLLNEFYYGYGSTRARTQLLRGNRPSRGIASQGSQCVGRATLAGWQRLRRGAAGAAAAAPAAAARA